MYLGGTLFSDGIFKKILSIGYEFETNDLAKLSLHENRRSFINSDLTLRILGEKIQKKSIKIIDDHYLHVRIPIHNSRKELAPPPPKLEPVPETDEPAEGSRKSEKLDPLTEEEDEEMKALLAEFEEEFEDEKAEEEYEKKRSDQERALAEKENDSYLEYFNENRKSDNKSTIKFQITNDLGDTPFVEMVKVYCESLSIDKNDMFFFQTNKGKMYDFKFSENIATNETCDAFSGVEFVATYYSPKRENANIIIETFVDACSRIVDHFGNLTSKKGTLLINNNDRTEKIPIGKLERDRHLYHKPGTNLYYMDTYDDEDIQRTQTIGDAEFLPQMTFRCKAIDGLPIMKEICKNDPKFKSGQGLMRNMEAELQDILYIESIVSELITKFNETSEIKIDITTEFGKKIEIYMFFIFTKLYMFISNHTSILSKKTYLKDFLTFSSRHSNIDFYRRIKEILAEYYKITDIAVIMRLFYNDSVLKDLYEPDQDAEIDPLDFDEEDNYKFNYDAVTDDLLDTDTHFGNPLFSLQSYFKYMETKNIDWLKEDGHDAYSTTFPLTGDNVLMENRAFKLELTLYLQNVLDAKFTKEMLTVKDMHKIVNKLYGTKNVKKLMTLTRHPTKNKLTKKTPAVLEAKRLTSKSRVKFHPISAQFAPFQGEHIAPPAVLALKERRSQSLKNKRLALRRTQKLTPILEG